MGLKLPLSAALCALFLAVSQPASAQISVGLSTTCQPDPATCQRGLARPELSSGDFRLFTFDEALLRISADPPPVRRRSVLAEDPVPSIRGVHFSRDRSWPDGVVVIPRNMMQASYDRPVPGSGLTILGSSAIADRPAAHHTDGWSNAARSNLGVSFNDYGIRLTVNPDVEANWGMRISDRMRYGVTNQLDTDLLNDVTLSFYSRYDGYSFSEDWRDYDELQNFVTLSYRLAGGEVVSIAMRDISGTNSWEDWNRTGPALRLDLPIAERVRLTLDNELLYARRNFHDDQAPSIGYQRNHDLQISWSPAAFAKYALNVIIGYTLNFDSAAERQYAQHNAARLGLTMRF